MRTQQQKSEKLYTELVQQRASLVAKYESNGEIKYEDACGIVATQAYSDAHPEISVGAVLTKETPDYTEDGRLVGDRRVLDFDAIRENCEGKTMRERFDELAREKVVTLDSSDETLLWGGLLMFDTPCMLKLESDINSTHRRIAPSTDRDAIGVVHSLSADDPANVDAREKKEDRVLQHRGQFKSHIYRGDREWLSNPVSLWSQSDKSRQSTFTLGVNSVVRMWGDSQVIDLNGFQMDHHERPNLVAGFASILDLSDGHFAGLSTQGAKNAHVYSSRPGGRLGRSNHTAFRGHFVDGLLVENVLIGDGEAKNKGTYFGTTMLNQSSRVVFKEVHQEQTNHHVTRSSLGLNWYAILTIHEQLFGKLVTPSAWVAPVFPGGPPLMLSYPWLKWEQKATSDPDTYGNGMTTPYPVIDPALETSDPDLYEVLYAAQESYRASAKNADDVYIQGNSRFNRNAAEMVDGKVTDFSQFFRVTNLTVANPINREEENSYPDSTVYGFRAGSSTIGVGNLASERIDPWHPDYKTAATQVYLIDCSFEGMAFSMTEAVTMYSENSGVLHSFGDMGLRPLGYSNSRNQGAGIAASSMHYSKASLAKAAGVDEINESNTPKSHPILTLDTAQKVSENHADVDIQAYSGLYKGNDVLETALATSTAIVKLQNKYNANLPPQAHNRVLSGISSGDNVGIGILAWRYSMMEAIGASTACQIGLKGGYFGDITDRNQAQENEQGDGEIYPWYKSKSKADSITYACERVESDGTVYYQTNADRFLDFGDERSGNVGSTAVTVKPISPVRFELIPAITDPTFDLVVSFATPRLDGTKPPSEIVDKDVDYFSSTDKVNRYRNTVEDEKGYFKPVPQMKTAWKFTLENSKMKLMKTDGSSATYGDAATLLGLNAPANASEAVEYDLIGNSDGQNHSAKGMFGVRLDQITDCGIFNTKVVGVENTGLELDQHFSEPRQVAFDSGIADEKRPGSHHNDFHGISINGCQSVGIKDFVIDDAITLGKCWGVEVRAKSKDVCVSGVTVDAMVAGNKYGEEDVWDSNTKIVGKPCIGVRVAEDCLGISLKDLKVRNISSSAPTEVKPVNVETSEMFNKSVSLRY